MDQEIIARVFAIIGSPLAVASDDGQKVFDKIAPLLREGRSVRLSFDRIETMIPAFLNAAVGRLYEEFPEDRIRKLLDVHNMSSEDLALLKQVNDNAKLYFKNRKEFDQAWKDEVDADDE